MRPAGHAAVVATFVAMVAYVVYAGVKEEPQPSDAEIVAEGLSVFKLPDGRTLEYLDSAPTDITSIVLLAMHGGFQSAILYKYIAFLAAARPDHAQGSCAAEPHRVFRSAHSVGVVSRLRRL